jgi:hypothetical protein
VERVQPDGNNKKPRRVKRPGAFELIGSSFPQNSQTLTMRRRSRWNASHIDVPLLSRDNIHIAYQRRQCLRTLDSADNHRFGASADRDFLPGQTIGRKAGGNANLF